MNFDEIKELPQDQRSRFGEIVFRGSIGSMFNLQHFNADPHPGNYILLEDGRVAFLDFGMTKKIDREQVQLEQRAFDAASRNDPEAFRHALHDLGFIKKPSKLDAERLLEHMGAVGGWYIEDREIEITPKRVMKIIESTHDPRSEYYDLMRRESIPAEELMGRRMEIGVVAVLGQLRAKRNWHQIFREWVYAGEPATELGQEEWEYFEERGLKRTPALPKRIRNRPTTTEERTMKRIKRGWALTKKSWALLNEHRELVRFPLYGALLTIPLAIVFLGPGLYLLDQKSYGGAIPILVAGVYVLSVVGVYFAVGLAAAANKIFQGEARRPSATGSPSPAAAFPRSAAGPRSRPRSASSWRCWRTRVARSADRRPPGRDGLGAGHLHGGAGAGDRGHRPVRDPEALGLDLQGQMGPADHRQHRDRRRHLPLRHPPRRAADRRRRRALALAPARPRWR